MLLYKSVETNSKGCSFFEMRNVKMDQKVKSVIDRLREQLERLYGEECCSVRFSRTRNSEVRFRLLVSVIVLTESFYRDYRSPFLQNVKREGVSM